MLARQMAKLRRLSLLFLVPGLGGLIVSAMLSTYYAETLPRWPAPDELRMTPRAIRGSIVYETKVEDRTLSLLEDSSVAVFLVGLVLGLVYLEKWSKARAQAVEVRDEPHYEVQYEAVDLEGERDWEELDAAFIVARENRLLE
jgi:hypothetical protein